MTIGNLSLLQIVFSSLLSFAFFQNSGLAQSYPNKSIRIMVPVPPGGATDFVARVIGQRFGEVWGQSVVNDYRGGAGGNIAYELTAGAAPDGYTLLMIETSFIINPSLYSKLAFDAVKDFAPITQVSAQAYFFVVHPDVPAKTIKELIALAKSKKGGIVYASGGSGTAGHLGMELLKTVGGFDAVHVPYKGAAPAMIDLIAGQVDAFVAAPSGMPHMKSGRMKAIAVTSLKRSPLLPNLPTVAESGVPGFEVTGVHGLLAPAGTPREIINKVYEEVSRSVKLPIVRDRLIEFGAEPVGSTPEQFSTYIQSEIVRWGKVVKQSGAKVN